VEAIRVPCIYRHRRHIFGASFPNEAIH